MDYDIIIITGETYFDHPLCGSAMIKRWLEHNDYSVGVIEKPQSSEDISRLGKPNLFFGITSGNVDSMLQKYTPMKRIRDETLPDRAVIVYSNWVKEKFKDSIIVLGGTEATLRRFTHYDCWQNSLRRPILFDSRADILVYGSGEKQALEIAQRVKQKKDLFGIKGTCVVARELPDNFIELPSYDEVNASKEKFCEMQLMFDNTKNLAQKSGTRYVLQYETPDYETKDLDEYYSLPFTREVPKELRGFQFSVVTHRGCIGNCNFCTLRLTQGNRIISRSERSILEEIERITRLEHFKGNIDDLGGPSANMYGMDCDMCKKNNCIDCLKLDRSNKKLVSLLKKASKIEGVKKIYIRSGIRFDLASDEYLEEMKNHIYDTLRIAPEHVNKDVLLLMNKNKGNLKEFIKRFNQLNSGKELSFYFIVGHPGSDLETAKELKEFVRKLKNWENVQVFTPTPMSVSTCMYYTGMNPYTKERVKVPTSFKERKEQKRIVME